MGSWISSLFSTTASPSRAWSESPYDIPIVLVGLTETGKSHFLSMLVHETGNTSETQHPTYGFYMESVTHHSYSFNFTELGFLVLESAGPRYVQQTRTRCVMWFIDEHDTLEEIHLARSYVMRLAAPETTQGGWVPPCLCIVHNVGRPRARRRKAVLLNGAQWKEPDAAHFHQSSSSRRGVPWSELRLHADTYQLGILYRHIMVMQLSYTDRDAPRLCFDWIIDKTTRYPFPPPSSPVI